MASTNVPSPPLSPTHIEQTIQTISRLHAEHHNNATAFQWFVGRATDLLGRSWFFGALTITAVCWIVANLAAAPLGYHQFDPPPFSGLGCAASVLSFFMVIVIVVTQRRDDHLALYREQLILELVISSEQKTAKVIQLLEEFRRDHPLMGDRTDQQADDMAQPADPSSVLDSIKDVHANAR